METCFGVQMADKSCNSSSVFLMSLPAEVESSLLVDGPMYMGGGKCILVVSVDFYSLSLGELEGPGEDSKLGLLGRGALWHLAAPDGGKGDYCCSSIADKQSCFQNKAAHI